MSSRAANCHHLNFNEITHGDLIRLPVLHTLQASGRGVLSFLSLYQGFNRLQLFSQARGQRLEGLYAA